MKRVLVMAAVAILLFGSTVLAVEVGVSYRARTGDTQFDLSLGNLNVAAQADISGFAADLSLSFGVPRPQIEVLLTKRGMAPADVYMAVKLANLTTKPLDVVVQEYEVNKKKGWGVIAKNLGIKPGSKEFHALKKDDSGMLAKAKGKGAKKEGKGAHKEGKGPKGKGNK